MLTLGFASVVDCFALLGVSQFLGESACVFLEFPLLFLDFAIYGIKQRSSPLFLDGTVVFLDVEPKVVDAEPGFLRQGFGQECWYEFILLLVIHAEIILY